MRDLLQKACVRIIWSKEGTHQCYQVDEYEREGGNHGSMVSQKTQVDETSVGDLFGYVETLLRPIFVLRVRAVSRRVLLHLALLLTLESYPRVKPGQGEVRQKVADDEGQRQDHQNAAGEIDVLAQQGLQKQRADQGQRQDDGDDC